MLYIYIFISTLLTADLVAGSLDDFLGNEYKIEEIDDNYGAVVGAMGASPERINRVKEGKPVMILKKTNDEYTMTYSSENGINSERKFKLGEEFQETFFGVDVKAKFTVDGNKLISIQEKDGKVITSTREFSEDGITETIKFGTKTSVLHYKKVQ